MEIIYLYVKQKKDVRGKAKATKQLRTYTLYMLYTGLHPEPQQNNAM